MSNSFARGFKAWCEKVSTEYRQILGLCDVDPLNAFDLAEYFGIPVVNIDKIPGLNQASINQLVKKDPGSWSAISITLGDRRLIILNPTHSHYRQQSNLMHELSHFILNHEPAKFALVGDGMMMVSDYDKKQEDEAHWLTGCLLLPRKALLKIKSSRMTEDTVKEKYSVSIQMYKYRINVTGVNRQTVKAKSYTRR